MKRILLTLCTLLAISITASAQRTAYGERIISAGASWTVSSLGGEIQYGQYLMNSYWFAAGNFSNRVEVDGPTEERVHFPRVQLAGGMMYRFYGSRSRSINIYGGGDVFVGLEMFDLWRTLSEPTRKSFSVNGFPDYRFIYGPALRFETEFFVSGNIALCITARVPICINTKFDILGYEVGGSVKYNF